MARRTATPRLESHGAPKLARIALARSASAGIGGLDLDRRAADLGLQRLGRALGDDPAVVDDPDAVGEHVGLLEVLRRQEDGDALVLREPPHLLPERRPALDVEAGRRLVEEEDARPVDERERQVEPALHAARVRLHLAVARLGQAHALEQLVGAPATALARQRLERRLQPQVLAAGEQRVERGLLQRGADHLAHLRPLRRHVEAADARRAGGRRQQRRQHQHGGRLAGAVRAEEAVDLAVVDGELDPVDRPRPLLELPDEPLDLDCALGHARQSA